MKMTTSDALELTVVASITRPILASTSLSSLSSRRTHHVLGSLPFLALGLSDDSALREELAVKTQKLESYDPLFENSKRRWAEIIKSDLEDYKAADFPNMDLFDGLLTEPVNQDVDDVLIAFYVGEIDGFGGTLGYAGPVASRLDSLGRSKSPISGIMVFDEVDFGLMSMTDIELIIIHEMAHVLGYGTYAEQKCGVDCKTADYSYTCDAAKRQHKLLGLPGSLSWEDEGEEGSKCSHLDESSFCNSFFCSWSEVMSAEFDSSKEQIISAVSLGVMEDLGYQVNYDAADDVPSSRRLRKTSRAKVFRKALKPDHTFSLDGGVIGKPETIPDTLRKKLGHP